METHGTSRGKNGPRCRRALVINSHSPHSPHQKLGIGRCVPGSPGEALPESTPADNAVPVSASRSPSVLLLDLFILLKKNPKKTPNPEVLLTSKLSSAERICRGLGTDCSERRKGGGRLQGRRALELPVPRGDPLPKMPLLSRNQGLPSPLLTESVAAGLHLMATAGRRASPCHCPIPTGRDFALVSPGSFSRCCCNIPARPTWLLFFPFRYYVAAHRGSGRRCAPVFLGCYVSVLHCALCSNSPVTPGGLEDTGVASARDNSSHAGFACWRPLQQRQDRPHTTDFTRILYTLGCIHTHVCVYIRTHTHTYTLGCIHTTFSIAINPTMQYADTHCGKNKVLHPVQSHQRAHELRDADRGSSKRTRTSYHAQH